MNGTSSDMIISEDGFLESNVKGSVTIAENVEAEIDGVIFGDLIIQKGSIVSAYGTVLGNINNNGGSLYVHGVVEGYIHTKRGMTQINFEATVKNCRR